MKTLLPLLLTLLSSTAFTAEKLPIIYSREYNIKLMGLQNFHPFDTEKYGRIYKYLRKSRGLTKENFYEPEICSEEDLKIVHPSSYLDSLGSKRTIARIAELSPLVILPKPVLYNGLLKPMKYGTGGTILGVDLALDKGWAINLSGGYHHAKADDGSGFCFFADIPIAIHKLWRKDPNKRVLIIDLDAHQGNGFQSILKDDKRISVLDVYGKDNYPQDDAVKKYITYDHPMAQFTKNSEYITLLREIIEPAVAKEKPDLIIYNAGTDIYKDDPLGDFRVTSQGIVTRDEIVFRAALKHDTPILMVLSGGYTRESSQIIGKSINNLLNNILPNGK